MVWLAVIAQVGRLAGWKGGRWTLCGGEECDCEYGCLSRAKERKGKEWEANETARLCGALPGLALVSTRTYVAGPSIRALTEGLHTRGFPGRLLLAACGCAEWCLLNVSMPVELSVWRRFS